MSKKPVNVYNLKTGETIQFSSIIEASDIIGYNVSNVSFCLRTERVLDGKYLLSYSDPNNGYKPGKNSRSKHVKCNETGEVFESQSQACLAMNLHYTDLNKNLHGSCKSASGFTFSFVEKQTKKKKRK